MKTENQKLIMYYIMSYDYLLFTMYARLCVCVCVCMSNLHSSGMNMNCILVD